MSKARDASKYPIVTAGIADDAITGAKIENNPTIAGNLTVSGNTTVSGGFLPTDPVTNKNIIINGNFAVHQRGGTITGNGDYNLDRWTTEDSGNIDNLVMNITQDGDTPSEVGEGTCLKYQCKTVESAVDADEFYALVQHVEARNLQHLGFGAAEAKSFTVSFWVKSSLTGVFGFSIYQDDGGDIVNGTYTISSAGTWEKKTFTFAGNTADTIANDSTRGWKVQWGLWVGSNYNTTASSTWSTYTNGKRFGGHVQNGLGTTDESTWQLAFVQVEAGSIATPFEHESYAETLTKCQRYYEVITLGSGGNPGIPVNIGQGYNNRKGCGPFAFKVDKRVSPTIANATIGIDGGDATHTFVFQSKTWGTIGGSTSSTDIGSGGDVTENDITINANAEI